MRRNLHRVGAVFYGLWGLLHIWAGGLMLAADARTQLDYISTAPLPPEELPQSLASLVNAGLSFHSYNLVWFGLVALFVAAFLNWRNSVTGYWINLVIVGADDIGLLWFLILPGHLAFSEAGLGPVLFGLAAIFSTLGVLWGPRAGTPASDLRQ
jgi:hypothetical protein